MGLPGKRRALWFQFLLGRLKTLFEGMILTFRDLFQFLLGRLKTRKPGVW